jgi:hypothetical protein
MEGNGRGLIYGRLLCLLMPSGAEENHGHRQNSLYPSRDLNPGHRQYEAGVLITRPQLYLPLSF